MVIDQLPVVNGRRLHPGSAQIMTRGFRRAWTTSLSVGMAPRSSPRFSWRGANRLLVSDRGHAAPSWPALADFDPATDIRWGIPVKSIGAARQPEQQAA